MADLHILCRMCTSKGGERSEPSRRQAALKTYCPKGNPQPSGRRPVKPKNPPAQKGRLNLRTFFHTTLLHNLPRSGAPPFFHICGVSRHRSPRPEGPSNFRTLRTFGPFRAVNPQLRRRCQPFPCTSRISRSHSSHTTSGAKGFIFSFALFPKAVRLSASSISFRRASAKGAAPSSVRYPSSPS